MRCTCGDPTCKVGKEIQSKDDRLRSVIQENAKLLQIIKEQQEVIALQKLFISELPGLESLAGSLRPLRKLR